MSAIQAGNLALRHPASSFFRVALGERTRPER